MGHLFLKVSIKICHSIFHEWTVDGNILQNVLLQKVAVSLNRGTPIYIPISYNPYCGDPQKRYPSFWESPKVWYCSPRRSWLVVSTNRMTIAFTVSHAKRFLVAQGRMEKNLATIALLALMAVAVHKFWGEARQDVKT